MKPLSNNLDAYLSVTPVIDWNVATGNTGTINAQFDLQQESLAYPPDSTRGEFLFNEICSNPVPEVIDVLRKFKRRRQMWPHLPGSIPLDNFKL